MFGYMQRRRCCFSFLSIQMENQQQQRQQRWQRQQYHICMCYCACYIYGGIAWEWNIYADKMNATEKKETLKKSMVLLVHGFIILFFFRDYDFSQAEREMLAVAIQRSILQLHLWLCVCFRLLLKFASTLGDDRYASHLCVREIVYFHFGKILLSLITKTSIAVIIYTQRPYSNWTIRAKEEMNNSNSNNKKERKNYASQNIDCNADMQYIYRFV